MISKHIIRGGNEMQSVFSWVDFSEKEKNKMYEIIEAISDPDTRDELGISPIRDYFANLMFPGTSTLHTRIKYMLFVPWSYKIIEEENLYEQDAAERMRELEIELIKTLKRKNNQTGIIGQRSGADLSRTPADIYWTGLKKWGILQLNVSRNDYHNFLKVYHKKNIEDYNFENDYQINDYNYFNERIQLWDPTLLEKPKDFPKNADLNLEYTEAEYLKEKIKQNCSHTVMSEVLDLPYKEIEFIWQHPYITCLDESLYTEVRYAQNFADTIYGANLLYNLMLTEADDKLYNDKREEYLKKIDKWKVNINTRKKELKKWKIDDFWQKINIDDLKLIDFFEKWINIIMDKDYLDNIESNDYARKLIRDREEYVKGKRARLINPRYLEKWGGASSAAKHDYRWSNVNLFIKDIKETLEVGDIDA